MGSENRILVVDDEVVIRELMVDILSDEGYAIESAVNGKAALERLASGDEFVVLFTDIMMPEMDGIELIHEAKKLAPSLVPIVMTGYATLETARAAVKEGAYDYVLKPFNLSEIKMAVSNALERSRLQNENARLHEITELFHISESIAAIRDEGELLKYVLSAALERVDAVRGSLMLVSEDGKQLEVAHSIGLPEGMDRAVAEMGDSISGWVAEHVQPLLVPDIRDNAQVSQFSRQLPGHSFVSVPLERKGTNGNTKLGIETQHPHVLAVLNVTDKRGGGSFVESDLKALSIVANHAAAALENVRLVQDLEEAQREIVFTLGAIVEMRSMETGNHVKRVAEYCKYLALKCGLSEAEGEILRLAAPLHDVGKVGIPDALLNKPGKLTAEEYDVVKTHAQLGYDMLKVSRGRVLRTAALVAREHHERFDGMGYPRGLRGTYTHIYGRITGIADVFDALGAQRSYKDAWELDRIVAYFREERGKHFDPELVDIFLGDINAITAIRDAFPENGPTA